MSDLTQKEVLTTEKVLNNFAKNLKEDLSEIYRVKPDPIATTLSNYFIGTRLASSWRESELIALRDTLIREKPSILVALETDLGVSAPEAEIIEFLPLIQELNYLIDNHRNWFQQSLNASIADYTMVISDGAKVVNLPVGNTLILGGLGNELSTIIRPLIYSMAAGNYNIVVPESFGASDKSTTLWTTLEYIIDQTMSKERVAIVKAEAEWHAMIDKRQVQIVVDARRKGSHEIARKNCAGQDIKYISHGRDLNIAIVDKHANLAEAAKAIGAHKFFKAGQDYNNLDVIHVHEDVHEEFINELKNVLFWHRGNRGPMKFQHGKILDEETFNELNLMIESKDPKNGQQVTSHFSNKKNLQINPVLYLNPDSHSKVMSGKNYSPVAPLVTFNDMGELLDSLSKKEVANNLYFFTGKRYIFEEAKTLLSARNLFYNSTSFYLKSCRTPNFVSSWVVGASLKGISGFQTFTRQKVITWSNSERLSFANSRYPITLETFALASRHRWINRLTKPRFLGAITALAGAYFLV